MPTKKKTVNKVVAKKQAETIEQLKERAAEAQTRYQQHQELIDEYLTSMKKAEELIAVLENENAEDIFVREFQGQNEVGDCLGYQRGGTVSALYLNQLELREPVLAAIKANLTRWQQELADLLDGEWEPEDDSVEAE